MSTADRVRELPASALQARTDAPRRPAGRVVEVRVGGGLDLPAELLEQDAPPAWVSRYVAEVAAAAAARGLDLGDFGRWDLEGDVRDDRYRLVPRPCRYPECECDRDSPCGSTS